MEDWKKLWSTWIITDPDNALSIINDNGWTEQYQNMYQNSLVGDANITKDKISKLV